MNKNNKNRTLWAAYSEYPYLLAETYWGWLTVDPNGEPTQKTISAWNGFVKEFNIVAVLHGPGCCNRWTYHRESFRCKDGSVVVICTPRYGNDPQDLIDKAIAAGYKEYSRSMTTVTSITFIRTFTTLKEFKKTYDIRRCY
jgi:hypothetical protein